MASEVKEDFMDLRVPSRMNSSCKRQREREKTNKFLERNPECLKW